MDVSKEANEFEPQKSVLNQEGIIDLCDSIKEETTLHEETLKQFRKNLSDILTPDVTDRTLLKWLRAKNFNLRKCEEIYRIAMSSNAVFKAQELEDYWEIPKVVELYEFCNLIGIAKDGTPVRYIAMGRGDLKGFVMSLDEFDKAKYCMKIVEADLKLCKEQSIKLGREISEITYIVDMEYFSIGQTFFSGVMELGFDFLHILQDIYPEIWSNILIVNVPYFFQAIFNIFKPIFRHTILQKMHVAGRDLTPNLLLKYIDAEVLPAFLGGTRVDSSGDPMCSEFMKFGGIIPENYYLRNRTLLNPSDSGVEVTWLQTRSYLNTCVVVRKANSIIRAQLRTEGGSVLSVLLYREFGPDPEILDIPEKDEYLDPSNKKHNVVQCSPYFHLQTHTTPIDNFFFAPWPGIYILTLDNGYNWLTQRKCIHRVRVLPPDV